MKRYRCLSFILTLVTLGLWLGMPAPAAAQDGMEDFDLESLPQETPECRPADLTTPYNQYADSTVDLRQLSIWYDYGREPYKKARHTGVKERYRDAVPYFWKVLVNDRTGRFKTVYSRLVECYMGLEEIDSALVVIFRGLDRFPDYALLHYHGGQIFNARNEPLCAIPHYEALVAMDGGDPAGLKNYYAILARLYFDVQDERAVEAQQKVTELDPENVEATTLLGQMMEFFGMNPMVAVESAFLKDTTNTLNAYRYGKLAFEAGDYEKTIRAFRAILASDPDNVEALSYIGRSQEGLGNLGAAIRTYQRALKVEPDNLNVLAATASAYSRNNDFATATNYVRRALRVDPNFGLGYLVMGEIYENSVSYCSGQRDKRDFAYDDKLVYELAQAEYEKAAARDSKVAAQARQRVRQLMPFVRTTEDIHMHSGRDAIRDACYGWIPDDVSL